MRIVGYFPNEAVPERTLAEATKDTKIRVFEHGKDFRTDPYVVQQQAYKVARENGVKAKTKIHWVDDESADVYVQFLGMVDEEQEKADDAPQNGPRPYTTKYGWERLSQSREVHILESGKDYEVEPYAVASAARAWAKKRGLTIKINVEWVGEDGSKLAIQFLSA